MTLALVNTLRNDLKESQINWNVMMAFIPIAFLTFLFHELGHWTFGAVLGNDMTISLNNSAPRNGNFINDTDALWSAMGGPVFTLIQALLFLLLTSITKSVYAFSIAFFAAFSRFYSLVFGGIKLQDEARISAMLDWNTFLVPAIVLILLFVILLQSIRIMKLSIKSTGYFVVLSVFAELLVIGVNKLL
jgi:hypothetical protein